MNLIALLALTGIAFMLACLSYYLVESRNYQHNKPILVIATIVLVSTAFMSLFDTNHVMFKESTVKIANTHDLIVDAKKKKV